MFIQGADFSQYQGKPDWNKVKLSGIEWVALRAAFGLQKDTEIDRNLGESRNKHLPALVYSWILPGDDVDRTADFVCNIVKDWELRAPAIDYENSQRGIVSHAMLMKYAYALRERTQKRVAIYTNIGAFGNDPDPRWAQDFDLWDADWGYDANNPNDIAQPRLPKPWTTWKFWQYWITPYGTVYGSEKPRLGLDWFNGTREDLHAYFAPRFSDIAGHWAEKDILSAASMGIVKGNTDGTFRPDNPATRAEVVAMIMRALRS